MSDPSVAAAGLGSTLSATAADQRLRTVFEIARTLATRQDATTMASEILSSLIRSLDAADAGIILLYDAADEQLVVKGARGHDLAALGQLGSVLDASIGGQVFRTGLPGMYSTAGEGTAAVPAMGPADQEIFRTLPTKPGRPFDFIWVPLAVGETKVGVLLLENLNQGSHFSSADLPFLQAMAEVIALAFENQRLLDDLQTNQALSETNRLKAELLSMLAHEMRTPLTSIKGYSTALLMEEAHFSPETQREFLQIIDEECDILQELIRDLLESSIIDAGLLRLEPQPLRLSRLAQEVVDEVAHRAPSARFLVDFPERCPIVDADPNRIAQVLQNLLDNAIKYSPQGGLVVVRGEVHEDEVVVSVADQGVGIAPEHLNRLFEKFFRVGTTLGRHVVGSGLGLPIAHSIIESHGGRIWAESQPGQGTTFYFTLPRQGPSQEVVQHEERQDE